jgi:hypothetical protein
MYYICKEKPKQQIKKIGLWCGIKLGNCYKNAQGDQILSLAQVFLASIHFHRK